MIRHLLEVVIEVIIVIFQLIFHLLLLVRKSIHSQPLDVLLEFSLPIALHERFLDPQLAEGLLQSLRCLFLHPLLNGFILYDFSFVG